MKKIAVALPFHTRDFNQAQDLLEWIRDLGQVDYHCFLVCPFVSMATNRVVIKLAKEAFTSAEFIIPSTMSRIPEPWPIGANKMFTEAAKKITMPFLWLEPDAIPLCEGWLDYINEEYFSAGKPFMGSINESPDKKKRHLSGVAVYPANTWDYFRGHINDREAFDMVNQTEIIANTYHTQLIYNFWGQRDLPPTFKEDLEKGDPINTLTIGCIPRTAVIFHRCKDLSLTKLLKKMKDPQ